MDNHDMIARDNRMNALEQFSNNINSRFHNNNPNNRSVEDIFVWHVREIRLAGRIQFVVYRDGNERNGYVYTGLVENSGGDAILDVGVMRVLQFFRNGQWLNAYFA